jgi:hypothetical protein
MLRRNEENGVSSPNPLAKLRPCCRRILITILIVNRQVSYFDDAELQRSGRKFGKRTGHFSVD